MKMLTFTTEVHPASPFEDMIAEILAGDVNALSKYSRWDIYAAYRSGRLRDMPDSIWYPLQIVIDNCMESM